MSFRLTVLASLSILASLYAPVPAKAECRFLVGECPELQQLHRDYDQTLKRREEHENRLKGMMDKAVSDTDYLFQPSPDVGEAIRRRTIRLNWLMVLHRNNATETRSTPADQLPGYRWQDGSVTPPVDAAASTPPSPNVSRGQPAYRPNEDEGSGDTGEEDQYKPKITVPAEDTATFTKAEDRNSFKLCPVHAQNHCYQFFNGVRPNRLVWDPALGEALQGFKGRLVHPGVDFSALINGLNYGLIRYQFAHLAGKTPDHHVEGLLCAGYSTSNDPSPSWQYCAYVEEVARYRTIKPRFE